MVVAKKRLEQFQKGLVKTFYFTLRIIISAGLGYISAKCSIFDDLSPFSLILLSCSYQMGMLPTVCYLGSTIGYLSLPFGIYLFKYITALTMIYVVYVVFYRSLHMLRGDMAVISGICCFISGFLFLLVSNLSLFSALLLIAESALICCCIFFVSYAVKGFKKNCFLTSRELIAASVTLLLILVSLHNIALFQMSVARIVGLIVVFVALNCLKISHAAVLGCSIGIILSAVGNGGEAIFTAFVVGTLVGCVFINFSMRFAEVLMIVVYYAVLLFFGKFPWNYWLFAEPMIAFAVSFFIPKEKMRRYLAAYIAIRLPKGEKKNAEDFKKIIEKCKVECGIFCPKAIACYQKNSAELIDLLEDLSERYTCTEDFGEIEPSLEFCIKPKAMTNIIKKQLTHLNSDDFDELTEQLNKITKNLELKMNSSINTIQFLSNEEKAIKNSLSNRRIGVKEINFIVDERNCRRCEILFDYNEDLIYEKIFKEVLSPHFPQGVDLRIIKKGSEGVVYANESALYRLSCSAVCKAKTGEEICGDNALAFSGSKGIYYLMLADGMGSGKEASVRSQTAVDLLKRLLIGGLSVSNAFNIFHSTARLQKNFGFTTLDICRIDLNKGIADFYKAGAYDSFYINEDKISIINGGGMPAGLCEHDRIKHTKIHLSDGDYLIMGSDGLSALNESLEKVLLNSSSQDVRLFSKRILTSLFEQSNGGMDDDVTIITAKFQKTPE